MKIIVKNNSSERQSPEVTIDTSTCHYPYAIREALQLALELDGYDEKTIKDVFNRQEDVKTEPQAEEERVMQEGKFEDTTLGFFNAISYLKSVDEKILTLIKPHEIVQHANRIWAKNLQSCGQAKPAQKQEFSYDAIGYGRAIGYLVKTCKYPQVSNLGQITDLNTIVAAANELWEQDNQTT